MPAKLPKKFTNENPDLEKQLGCVAGIFQMFDRHHFLTGRRVNDHKQKKHSSGQDPPKSGRHESEKNPCFPQIFQEKNLSKYLYENEKASLESSRASSASSTSSSFSSLEFNKSSQQDACSFERTFFPERPLRNSPKPKNSEHDAKSMCFDSRNSTPVAKPHCPSSNLRNNAVKETMKRDTKIFTIKASVADKVKRCVVKHIDSPRPAPLTQMKMPADLDEAIRVLIELKKAPWNFAEQRVKDASFYQESHKSTPRFSMDSQDNSKSSAKLRELPRLSLDSRQDSQKCSNFASNTSLTLEDLDKINRSPCINRAANLLQDLGSETRHPGIVAKLMGLEGMPFQEPASRSRVPPSATQLNSDQIPRSIQRKDSIVKKPEDHISLQKTKAEFSYEDIEKRLKRHQSLQQNKDLKDLKKIVEAMRAKQLAQMTKDAVLPSKVSTLEDYTNRTPKGSNQSSTSPRLCKQPAKSCGTTQSFDSPIVIMKPARSLNISDASAHSIMQLEDLSTLPKLHTSCTGRRKCATNITTDRKHSPRVRLGEANTQAVLSTDKQFIRRPSANTNSPRYHSNSAHSLSKMQEGVGEYTGVSSRTLSAVSPRLQQVKMEQENKAIIRSTDRKPVEPVSPRGRLKLRQSQTRKSDDQIDENFPASYKNGSLALRSTVLQQSVQNPSSRTAHNAASLFNHKSSAVSRNQYRLEKEHAIIDFEHSSPVSVLDASSYQDEFPASPVRRPSKTVKDFEYLPNAQVSDKKFRYSLDEEELQVLNFITSKCCDMQNPDHKYLSEILMATGILNNGRPDNQFHLRSPFPAISPNLFGVLEKNQEYTQSQKHNVEKDHRKLVFDVINEILSHKRESNSHGKWPESLQQKREKQSGQDLLEELCSEIKQLQARFTKPTSLEDDAEFMFREDILHQAEGWENFGMEKTKVGLQIERLILRDLINEVVGDITEAGKQGNTYYMN